MDIPPPPPMPYPSVLYSGLNNHTLQPLQQLPCFVSDLSSQISNPSSVNTNAVIESPVSCSQKMEGNEEQMHDCQDIIAEISTACPIFQDRMSLNINESPSDSEDSSTRSDLFDPPDLGPSVTLGFDSETATDDGESLPQTLQTPISALTKNVNRSTNDSNVNNAEQNEKQVKCYNKPLPMFGLKGAKHKSKVPALTVSKPLLLLPVHAFRIQEDKEGIFSPSVDSKNQMKFHPKFKKVKTRTERENIRASPRPNEDRINFYANQNESNLDKKKQQTGKKADVV